MLKIKNLNYSVLEKDSKKDILKDINIEFNSGKTYCITGPNGSGKSTLVKMIIGILRQTDGNIVFDGKDISNLEIDQRANLGISFAFQKPVTFKGLKVRDLLDIASGKKNDFSSVCSYLSEVGLCAKDYINRYIDDNLSGGELKRIEIAMALARKCKLNIFDEPEAGIDLWSFDNLTELFSSLKDCCNIIVSHQRKILEMADYIVLLKDGVIEKVGTLKELEPYLQKPTCARLAR